MQMKSQGGKWRLWGGHCWFISSCGASKAKHSFRSYRAHGKKCFDFPKFLHASER